MSKENYDDIDAVLGVLNKGNQDKKFEEIEKAVTHEIKSIPTTVWGVFEDTEPKVQVPVRAKYKSIGGGFKTLAKKAREFLGETTDDILYSFKHITLETLVSIALVLGLISSTIAMTFPNIKCNKFRNKLKEEIEARSYESYSAGQIVEELGIDRYDYFRIYLLSYGMSSDMYYKILNELGYSDLSTIARKEGYKNTEYERATELLTKDYETKLQQIIDKMHDEPEQTVSYYCNLYPELIPYVLSEHDLALYLCGPEKGLIK